MFVDGGKNAPKGHADASRVGINLMFIAEDISKSELLRRFDMQLGNGGVHKHTAAIIVGNPCGDINAS